MYLNKLKAKIVKEAIANWEKENVIDEEMADRLRKSISTAAFDWKRLAAWAFYFAIACFFISFASLFAADWFIEFMERLADLFSNDIGRLLISTLFCGALYYKSFQLRRKAPERIYLNQSVLFLAVVANAWAIGELGYLLSSGSGHFSLLMLLASIMYAAIGYYGRSNLVWIFALLSFGSWLGAETGYMSGWGAYYLGMNYPLRFLLFGVIMTAVSLNLRNNEKFNFFFSATLSVSLLYLFIALWLLSIFGNYDYHTWYGVKQIELFHWSLLFALASCAAFYLGLKLDIRMLRSYGIVFLGINLYTRYFEFFWDAMDKSIFFALLGLSLWLLAKKAETIWLKAEEKFGKLLDEHE